MFYVQFDIILWVIFYYIFLPVKNNSIIEKLNRDRDLNKILNFLEESTGRVAFWELISNI